MKISFNFLEKTSLSHRVALRSFMGRIFEMEKCRAGQVNFIFCSDDYILEINENYLQHDYFTDIITFDLTAEGSASIDAEIYISVDTVKDNATRFETTFTRELHRVMFHGLLHLIGYDDKTPSHQLEMTEKEEFYLQLYLGQP